MTLNLSVPTKETELKPRITVIGVGGAGGNAVNNMIRARLEGVEFVVANTDAQAIAQSVADRRIQLGVGITQGLGAGSRPDIGRAAAEEAIDEILEHLAGSHMVFIAAGMGGGTGTGAGPVIARAAREQGILTVGVVTKPFHFEGQHRMRTAEAGLEQMQQVVDTLIIIPNQNLFRVANERTTFADAFKMADDVLYSGVRGVTDLMVMPGLINLDFADIRTVMAEMGKAMMGTGEAEGDSRALDAAQKAISNPLLDDVSMKGARGVLINITGGMDMTLFEVDEAANRIRDEVDPEANIIFGSTFDAELDGRMRVTVVATGIEAAQQQQQHPNRPTVISLAASRPGRTHLGMRGDGAVALKLDTVSPMVPAMEPEETAEPVVATAAPVPLPPAPAPVASPSAAAAMPRPTASVTGNGAFVPPPPVEAGLEARLDRATPKAPEPFAAAAMANGATEPPRPVMRGFRLLERVTGAGRARLQQAQEAARAALQPQAQTAPAATPAAAPAPAATPAPAPTQAPAAGTTAQQRLGGLDPADRLQPSRGEDDLLDIPAFLRRQAN